MAGRYDDQDLGTGQTTVAADRVPSPGAHASDRRTRQEAPSAALDRFRTAYAQSPVGFALLTDGGRVAYVNQSLRTILGAPEVALLDRALPTLVHPDDHFLVGQALDDTRRGAPSARVVARFEVDGGPPRWADVTIQLIRDRSDQPYLYTVHIQDETEHVEALSQLGHAARVSLVSALAPGIGHDLRNSLAVLVAHAELLGPAVPASERHHLQAMVAAIRRAHDLAGQMIDLARPGPPSRELLDLGGLVSSLETVLRTMARPDLDVRIRSEAALVVGDPLELERVLLTLVANGVEAIHGAGSVTIEVTRVADLTPGTNGTNGTAGGAWVRMRVHDTGPGMNRDTLHRAFEPYFTTKRAGTGLGLATSRTLIEALGGTIGIRTDEGSGTTVDVHLPDAGAGHPA